MRRLLPLAVLLTCCASLVHAQRAPAASPYTLGADPVQAVSPDGRVYTLSGQAAVLTGLDAPTVPGDAETKARAFLAGQSRLGSAAAELALVSVRTRRAGTVVRLQQTVGGVPVWNAVTTVSLDRSGRIQFVADGARAVAPVELQPAVSADAAVGALRRHLGADGGELVTAPELVVWPSAPARLAWRLRLHGGDVPPGEWEGVVDALTGELLRAADRAVYHGDADDRPHTALPLAELSPAFRVRGYGYVFDPDPPTVAGVRYGGDIADNNDGDNAALDSLRSRVLLRDLAFDGTDYELKNEWADITEWDAPTKGIFLQDSLDFRFQRSQDAFEAVSAFWHIDNYMRYVNETLQLDVRPTAYPGGVQFDPHGVNGQDNSYYFSSSQRMAFGEGCVDDAEDADVVVHELGHGLHDWITDGGLSNGDGLSEGTGDYLAVSYARSLGLLDPTDDAYNWVFRWVGHQPCWPPGRITNVTTQYPQGSAPHARGQHWSTSLLRVWDVLGREATDLAMFEGLSRTTNTTTQPQAALAVVQAAIDLGYPDDDVQTFIDSFNQQGYNLPPVSAERLLEAGPGAQLTAARPNPFNGLTTLDVVLSQPQAVTVEVFDAVGRRVAVLFEGELPAGKRLPVALDAAGLRPGVYLVRLSGPSASASRRVTVVR